MINVIVYSSFAGHTKEYAMLLHRQTDTFVTDIKDAEGIVPENAEILFFGWLMAGKVKGYKEAAAHYRVKAVCAVGMSAVEAQREDIRRQNGIPESTPLFCLQGGFEMEKLHGIYKLMMKVMRAVVGKKLSAKKDRTPEEEESLELLMNGKNCVSPENLKDVLEWYEKNGK